MNYQIVWLRAAVESLAAGYLEARADGLAAWLNTALADVERQLAREPLAVGESRSEAKRVLHVSPATIEYEAFPDSYIVVVETFRYAPPRRRGDAG